MEEQKERKPKTQEERLLERLLTMSPEEQAAELQRIALSKQKGIENQKLGDVKSKATRAAGLHYLKKVEKVFQQLDDSEEAINKKTKEASSWWGGQQQGLLGPEDPALSKKEALSDINSLRALLLMSVEATFELLVLSFLCLCFFVFAFLSKLHLAPTGHAEHPENGRVRGLPGEDQEAQEELHFL
jgi:hypothetical protein